ncbi:MAG: thermonuclease family protein [Magnetovibrio sp.]|nr:thermonuclease family protein [Magnetovibrio sp.]
MRGLAAIALLLALPAIAGAADDAAVRGMLAAGPGATVTAVVDGDTVVVDPAPSGAGQVRLVGIQAPKLALGRKGFREWPLAPDAKRALERLVMGRPVTLAFGGTRMDRHGRHLAHLFTGEGVWVQGRLLADGMARVYSFPDNRAVVPAMLAREGAARAAGLGIWSHPFYAVRAAEPGGLMKRLGTFQLVEGRVRDAARVKSRVYLNFGADWRTDFTVALDGPARRAFAKAGLDPLSLKDKRLRVRGWLRKRNGPLIDASHPEQLEVVDP